MICIISASGVLRFKSPPGSLGKEITMQSPITKLQTNEKLFCLSVRYKVDLGEAIRVLDAATIERIGGTQESVITGREESNWSVFTNEIETDLKAQVMVCYACICSGS